FQRDPPLLPSDRMVTFFRVLTRNSGRYDRHRCSTDIRTELEIFVIAQSHRLMVTPKVALWFASFQWPDRIFPMVDIFYTLSVCNTPARKTNKTRFNIRQCLS